MTTRGQYKYKDRFMGPLTLTTTPAGRELGWTKKITETTAQSTFVVTASGLVLTLGAANESKVATIYQNDVLPFLISKLKRVAFTVNVTGITSVHDLVFGLASAQNDTLDSVATLAWFKLAGTDSTSNIVCETDDGTTDLDDKASGTTLAATPKRFEINFTQGLADVRFFIDGQPVATSQTFSMAAASSTQGVQLFVQFNKASGTAAPTVVIRDVEIEGDFAD